MRRNRKQASFIQFFNRVNQRNRIQRNSVKPQKRLEDLPNNDLFKNKKNAAPRQLEQAEPRKPRPNPKRPKNGAQPHTGREIQRDESPRPQKSRRKKAKVIQEDQFTFPSFLNVQGKIEKF